MKGYYWGEGRQAQDMAAEIAAQREIVEALEELVDVLTEPTDEDVITGDDLLLWDMDLFAAP